MQYRGVVHCVGGDNTHTNAVQGVVHCVGGDNTHTNGYTVKDVVGTLLKEPLSVMNYTSPHILFTATMDVLRWLLAILTKSR